MKQLIVLAFLCLAGTHFADAQVKKGNVLVGGTAGISWEKEDFDYIQPITFKSTQYFIAPRAGYAFKDNWVAGVVVRNSFVKGKTEPEGASPSSGKAYTLSPGVFVRHYKMIGEKVGLFGEAGAYYSYGSNRQNDVKTYDSKGCSVEVQPGITYFVNKRWMIEGKFGGLDYSYTRYTSIANNTKGKSNSFAFDFGEQFDLGVAFLF